MIAAGHFRALAALLVLALAAALAQAAPAHVEAAVPHARLAGSGSYSFFAIRIYSAELWVGDRGYDPGAPFALELRYARKLDGRKIAEASVEQMEKTGAGTPAQRKQWLQQMAAMLPGVKAGDRIAGVSVPAQGARFYLDGRPLGSVDDPDFARAFFGIWLDPATTAPALRQALLKQAAPK